MEQTAHRTLDYQMLLETIDSLRARKARPDKTRICAAVQRKYGFDSDQTLQAIEHAVLDSAVLRVRYKDGYSYRNPGRSMKPKRGPGQGAAGSSIAKHRVLLAVRRLGKAFPEGVPFSQILLDVYSTGQYESHEEVAIKRLLDNETQLGS